MEFVAICYSGKRKLIHRTVIWESKMISSVLDLCI